VQLGVCVWWWHCHVPVMSADAVVCLCCMLHRGPGDGVGSFSVFPVWSECVCVVCVLAGRRRFVCCVWQVLTGPGAVFVALAQFRASVVVCVAAWVGCVLLVTVWGWV
jgi:hypothetical protein